MDDNIDKITLLSLPPLIYFFGLTAAVNKFSKVGQNNFHILVKNRDKNNRGGSYKRIEDKK